MSDPKNPTPSLDVHNLDVHNLDVHNSETILDTGAAASGDAEPTLASGAAADSTTGRDLGSIGPYRLVKKLGEGGMGQAWLAEQSAPVKRRVALKVIKAGQYDDAALQRFDLERQTLAIMEHPAIAKVFDAGAIAEGQPYFVMEYVPGLPITEYCDQKRITPRERLGLIIKVCEGVQHAGKRDEALSLLREAIDHGIPPSLGLGIESDSDLQSLHGDPRFDAVVAHAKEHAAAAAKQQ